MKKILIHSGGGCKGYLSLQLLKKIEKEHGPLFKYYDLMAGSSVGAINTAILATGKITANDLEKIYPEVINIIFKRKFGIPMYDRNNFVEVWKDLIGLDFKMKDCKTKLQITAVNLCDGRNHFFKSWEEKDGKEKLIDVVLRSFAAPLYFGKLIDEKNNSVWFDGGMGGSNLPISEARIETRDVLEWDDDLLLFDAVGTGFKDESLSFKKAKRYRVFRQLFSFFDLPDGGLARSQSSNEQVSRMEIIAKHQKNIGFRYWDIKIPKKIDKLDGKKYLREYKEYGIKMSKSPLIMIMPNSNSDYCG